MDHFLFSVELSDVQTVASQCFFFCFFEFPHSIAFLNLLFDANDSFPFDPTILFLPSPHFPPSSTFPSSIPSPSTPFIIPSLSPPIPFENEESSTFTIAFIIALVVLIIGIVSFTIVVIRKRRRRHSSQQTDEDSEDSLLIPSDFF